MAAALIVPAPAKLNLFLHVVGRRADGYHLLETLFRFVAFGDRITLRVREDGVVARIDDVPGVPEERDLCLRAARALQTATATPLGVDIGLEKRLPVGGGVGGGSSDAASVLLALNRLWGLNWPRSRLQDFALALGADVPVFVFGRTAFAQGIGEVLETADCAPSWYVVLAPAVQVATPDIFAEPALTRNAEPARIRAFPDGWGRNDLEPVVLRKYPEVRDALGWLRGRGDARLTGSGACVFAAFPTEAVAREVFAARPGGMAGFVARGLDRHPLHAYAD